VAELAEQNTNHQQGVVGGKAHLPRGPRSRILQAYAYDRDAFAYFESCSRKYGDPFLMKTLASNVVVTGDPKGIAEIFTADPETFAPFERDHLIPINGPSSMMVLSGQRLRQEHRRLARPLSGPRMAAYAPLIRDAALRQAAQWRPGEPFAMLDAAEMISLEVLLGVMLGVPVDRLETFKRAVFDLLGCLKPPPYWVRTWRGAQGRKERRERFDQALANLDGLIRGQIASRRDGTACPFSGGTGGAQDVLSVLVEARDEDGLSAPDSGLRDQMVTLLLAGRATAGTAMAWAFYWLHRYPEVRERLLAELATVPALAALATDGAGPDPAAIMKLPYLEAVCCETLRLYPAVSDAPRLLSKPFRLLGYELPPGMAVDACITLVHLREDLFPEPQRWRPERFLERSYTQFEFIPFGGGVRHCPGAFLAMHEMKLVLATLLTHCRFRLLRDEPPQLIRRSSIMSPRDRVTLVLEERR
jgi:cytochrome P450